MALPSCRSCGSTDLHDVLSLGDMPLANALLTEQQLGSREALHPLAICMCGGCSLVQLTQTVPPDELFSEYAYFSSHSGPMVDHARDLVRSTHAELGLGPSDLVVEIASNDGYLLQHYATEGIPVLGIDPAENVVKVAVDRGIETRCAFFTSWLAREMSAEGLQASVVHANNVLAHVPEINDFVAGVATLLSNNGVFIVETPYVRDMIDKLEFDTIYHEHVFYYSLNSIKALFERNDLKIVRAERIPIHGGSLRVHATRSSSSRAPDPTVDELLFDERVVGMTSCDYYGEFAARVEGLLSDLRDFLAARKAQGRSIAGYGAAAKGTVLLNAAGVGHETIDYIVDDTPYKQGRFVPGARIPIRPPSHLLDQMPDDVMIFAWNFAAEIVAKESAYRSKGGTFLLPLPVPRALDGGSGVEGDALG